MSDKNSGLGAGRPDGAERPGGDDEANPAEPGSGASVGGPTEPVDGDAVGATAGTAPGEAGEPVPDLPGAADGTPDDADPSNADEPDPTTNGTPEPDHADLGDTDRPSTAEATTAGADPTRTVPDTHEPHAAAPNIPEPDSDHPGDPNHPRATEASTTPESNGAEPDGADPAHTIADQPGATEPTPNGDHPGDTDHPSAAEATTIGADPTRTVPDTDDPHAAAPNIPEPDSDHPGDTDHPRATEASTARTTPESNGAEPDGDHPAHTIADQPGATEPTPNGDHPGDTDRPSTAEATTIGADPACTVPDTGDPGLAEPTAGPGTDAPAAAHHQAGDEQAGEGNPATRPDLSGTGGPADATLDDPAVEDTVADDGVPAVPVRPAAGDGRGGPPEKRARRRRRYLRRAIYALVALILLPIVGFVVVYLLTPIPSSAQPTAKAQKSSFYYSDGKTLIARSGDFDRRPVDLKDVPKHVQAAVISAENRSFYSDPGVSLKGSARAVWATLTGGSTQGGSTITQQMVRNYYSGLSQDRTVSRKLKEIMIALKVGREKDKDWILQQYLNTIYFGRDAYGIEAAAQAYYHTDVRSLTPAQGAYLAAAIQLPNYFSDPKGQARAYAESRWRYVIGGMVQSHAIGAQDAAAMKFPLPEKERQKSVYAGDKGYMVSQAKAELRRMGYTDNQINMGGLRVRTTFDKDLMDAAAKAVRGNMPPGTPKSVSTGLVSVDPATGEVLAFYGGKNYLDQQFNNAFDASVQAGSGFKPYVLAAALDDGMSLDDYVDGSSPQRFRGTPVKNDEGRSFGMINLVTATQNSVNTAYVNLGQKVGLDKVVQMAEKLGITRAQLTANGADTAPTLPLGVVSVTPMQQAGGFAAFASEGTYHTPHVVKEIKERTGKTREPDTTGQRVFSQTVARDATYAMQRVIDGGTGTAASLPDRNAAGKTGTTDSGKTIWFNGFIPQLSTSVAMFNRQSNKPLTIPGYSAYGGQLPAQIWRAYMVEADRRYPAKSFGSPSITPGGQNGIPSPPAPTRPRPTKTRHSTPPEPTHEPTHEPSEPTHEPPHTGLPTEPAPPRQRSGGLLGG